MKKISFLLVIILTLFALASCRIKMMSEEDYVDMLYRYHVLMEEENVCIDLRNLENEYANGHIKGFINYDYQNGSDEEFLIYMNSMYNKKIYIFLIDQNGENVEHIANLLKQDGYKHIIVYTEGYQKLENYAKDYLSIVTGVDDCGC